MPVLLEDALTPPTGAVLPAADASLVGDIEAFLQEAISSLTPLPAGPPSAGRPRILPSLCLWAGVLVCLLRGATHQNAVWRLLAHTGLWQYPRFPLSDEAIYQRLATESAPADGQPPLLERLFRHVTTVLTARLAPYADATLAPFANAVLALDETSLDAVHRWLPALHGVPPKANRLYPGKLAALFDVRRQVWHTVVHVPAPHQNEKKTAPTLLSGLAAGVLLVMDLGYFSFAWFDTLTDQGVWWVSRLRAKTSYTLVHTFYQQDTTLDCLVWLGAYRSDRSRYLVRLVRFTVGRVTYSYLTNQLDPVVFPLREIARVYQRRWDIECAFQLVKEHLQLCLLWSSQPAVLLQQVWGVLISSQVLQALRLEIAGRAAVDPFDVSLPLLVAYVPQLLAAGEDPVAVFVTEGRRLGFIRPSRRSENRAPWLPRAELIPRPPDLVLERMPRHAQRNCGPRIEGVVYAHD